MHLKLHTRFGLNRGFLYNAFVSKSLGFAMVCEAP